MAGTKSAIRKTAIIVRAPDDLYLFIKAYCAVNRYKTPAPSINQITIDALEHWKKKAIEADPDIVARVEAEIQLIKAED